MPMTKSVLPRHPSPPTKENASIMKQGIVAILRSDPEKSESGFAANSIRRTLSADMSSKKWREQNGFPFAPIKKIAHLKELIPDSSSDGEEVPNRPRNEDIWRSIRQEKEKNALGKPNIWGSLVLTAKDENRSELDLSSPYVHPLVKRSASMLSEKSLEICTESLGSETGSDCFLSYPASEFSDVDKVEINRAFMQENFAKETNHFEDLQVNKYKFSPVRPFPPPITSIAGGDGASLHMHSKRGNGRLVLEAVSVPSRNYFHAQRQDGRLVLSLINSSSEVKEVNKGEVFDNMEDVDERVNNHHDEGGYSEEEEEKTGAKSVAKGMEFVESTRHGMLSVHKTGLVMKKLVEQGNQNLTWSKKVVNMIVEEENLASLPPAPRVAHLIPSPPSASWNAYDDYFWRKSTMISPITALKNNYLVMMKEKKEDHFAPYLRACKDGRRRSLLIWEPYCIATS